MSPWHRDIMSSCHHIIISPYRHFIILSYHTEFCFVRLCTCSSSSSCSSSLSLSRAAPHFSERRVLRMFREALTDGSEGSFAIEKVRPKPNSTLKCSAPKGFQDTPPHLLKSVKQYR